MAVIDRVKWDGSPGELVVWKYPSEELSTFTQLIVNESQEAFLVKDGVYEGPFEAGRHTLETANIPILRSLMGIPFGGYSPFSAEVWFVKRSTKLDVMWGTGTPIQLLDPQYKVMIPVRAHGQYGLRIKDSKKFLLKLVGTLESFDVDILSNYFRGIFVMKIKSEIAKAIIKNKISILEISTSLDTISAHLQDFLALQLSEFGVGLEQFTITSINIPEDDTAVRSLKDALAKRAEMDIVGFDYRQERSFDVMEAAASNEGSSSAGVMGAGMGMGLGVGLGVPMGNAVGSIAQQVNFNQKTEQADSQAESMNSSYEDKLEILEKLSNLKDKGILSKEEFEIEKRKILMAD